LDDQVFELLVDTGASHRLSLLRAIEFLSDELAMPGENGIGFDDVATSSKACLPNFLPSSANVWRSASVSSYAPLDLMAQDAIFSHEILVSKQEFLINRARDVGQQGFPIHVITLHFCLDCS
jgi:hypothetical protein